MSTARPPGDTLRLARLYNTCMRQLRPFVAGSSLWQSQITTECRRCQKPLSLVLGSIVVNKQRSKLGRSNGEQVARIETGRYSECWSSKIKLEMTSKQSWHRSNPRRQRSHVTRLTNALQNCGGKTAPQE